MAERVLKGKRIHEEAINKRDIDDPGVFPGKKAAVGKVKEDLNTIIKKLDGKPCHTERSLSKWLLEAKNTSLSILTGDNEKQVYRVLYACLDSALNGRVSNQLIYFYIAKYNGANCDPGIRAVERIKKIVEAFANGACHFNVQVLCRDSSNESEVRAFLGAAAKRGRTGGPWPKPFDSL